ncbi:MULTISPECIES: NIPSNAP family protein [unclassified Pseudoxanthomonas]|uniref:NIPSNAP family protein n=1 Tax=unclassified Pseudoxanthomonas TaxID=2645906 RepID=UPI003076CB60
MFDALPLRRAEHAIVELRQYTLHPGRRDELIELFEREFLESQEAVAMEVIGQFRDLDHPDSFVWLRGFSDMSTRRETLADFYGGPVWKANRDAANATMIDSDNVLLLRPAYPGSGFRVEGKPRPPGAMASSEGLVVANLHYFDAPVSPWFLAHFHNMRRPPLAAMGATLLASFVTDYSENTFTALPVREGEHVFAWFAHFADEQAYARYWQLMEALSANGGSKPPQVPHRVESLRLKPTARSRLGISW